MRKDSQWNGSMFVRQSEFSDRTAATRPPLLRDTIARHISKPPQGATSKRLPFGCGDDEQRAIGDGLPEVANSRERPSTAVHSTADLSPSRNRLSKGFNVARARQAEDCSSPARRRQLEDSRSHKNDAKRQSSDSGSESGSSLLGRPYRTS